MESNAADSLSFDVVVIGAGPTGLACGIDAKRAGFTVTNIDKGCLVNSLYNYPSNMTFFTTPELLEIGDIPFSSPNQKPTRQEALEYYRKVAEHYQLDVRQYEPLQKIGGADNNFTVHTVDLHGRTRAYRAHKLILATGYYDRPNLLNVPGEELPKVLHYYREPHPFFGLDVLIVGGKNSAAIAALELWRHGAKVTIVHRHEGIGSSVKYWIKPDIENRIRAGQVKAYFNSTVKEITPDYVVLATPEGEVTLANDWVFAMTASIRFSRALGIQTRRYRQALVNQRRWKAMYRAFTWRVLIAGMRTSEIFIENGRFHGQAIAADLKKLTPEALPLRPPAPISKMG
jgi:thioredoxin reductase (NADPH)